MYRYNIALWLIALFVLYMIFSVGKIATTKRSRLKWVDNVPDEYKNLFNQSGENIREDESYILYNTNFNPISYFHYNGLWVVITKFKITPRINLLPNIYIKYEDLPLTENYVYAGFDRGYYHVDILPETNIVKTLDLTVDGSLVNNVKWNRNAMAYNFKLKSISLSYDETWKNDLKIQTSADSTLASIVFIKHEQSLYLIFAGQSNPTNKIESLSIQNILRNEITRP